MKSQDERDTRGRLQRWLRERTRLPEILNSVFDEPTGGLSAWIRTTAGIVALLFVVQVVTGVLMAFYYVPSTDAAHATTAYIEKVVPAGSWIRALHHYGSQWLTLFLVLHLAQQFWRANYRQRPVAWLATVFVLALVLKGGVTGYSLPWDARAFFGTRVAEGIAAGIPFIGTAIQRWLIGGTEITALTLPRFFALHVLVTPALLLLVISARLFVFREPDSMAGSEERQWEPWKREQFARQSLAAGFVFLALALYAMKYHAPLGPAASEAGVGYLPRPGAQFLWLFQMLKYLPGGVASTVAAILPGLIFVGLGALPFLDARKRRKAPNVSPKRRLSAALFLLGCLFIASMTALAYIADRRDGNTRTKLAEQAREEAEFRAAPFEPLPPRISEANAAAPGAKTGQQGAAITADNPPASYLKHCANCHGKLGQGVKPFPKLLGVSTKPRRTVEDIIGLLNDPGSYGLEPPMKSFATKLTDDEKRDIAMFVMLLKKT